MDTFIPKIGIISWQLDLQHLLQTILPSLEASFLKRKAFFWGFPPFIQFSNLWWKIGPKEGF